MCMIVRGYMLCIFVAADFGGCLLNCTKGFKIQCSAYFLTEKRAARLGAAPRAAARRVQIDTAVLSFIEADFCDQICVRKPLIYNFLILLPT